MKNFIQLQPRSWQMLYEQYNSLKRDGNSSDTIREALTSTLSQTFRMETAAEIADKVLVSFEDTTLALKFYDKSDNPDSEAEYVKPEAQLTIKDIELLREKLASEDSKDAARLLVSFLVYARANPHPSNWIKYDSKVIMFLSSLQKKRVADQTSLTNKLHCFYGLNLRVVGSKNPIPCFNIAWHDSQPPVNSPDNPLVDIGPLEPSTISNFVETTLGITGQTPSKRGS